MSSFEIQHSSERNIHGAEALLRSNSRKATYEMSWILWSLKFHYCVENRQPLYMGTFGHFQRWADVRKFAYKRTFKKFKD
jgi:hypothetical protein